MVDFPAYRRAETEAMGATHNWRDIQAHRPVTFEAVGFPTRMESIMDLRPILDSMQDNAWTKMQREMGGLSEADVEMLVHVLASWREFATLNFGIRDGRLPFDAMLAHLGLYRKLCRHSFQRILEVGPGVGYLSFFLEHDKAMRAYSQIENTESYYVLQHLVNRHCFGTDHLEIALGEGSGKCLHWPWWRRDDLACGQFDIITSNANLTEMTITARTDFISLFDKTLAPNGALFIQGYGQGYGKHAVPVEAVEEKIARTGLIKHPVICVGQTMHVNALWMRPGVVPPEFVPGPEARREYTKDEIAARVAGDLESVAA